MKRRKLQAFFQDSDCVKFVSDTLAKESHSQSQSQCRQAPPIDIETRSSTGIKESNRFCTPVF